MKQALILFIMAVFLSNQTYCQSILDLMPGDIEGWTLREPVKVYTPETLYDYIDGGAELYLSYGMKEVASRIIIQDDNEIRIEIFDMEKPGNAFGVFTHTRTKDEKIYGQGSQFFTGALIFWKDRYFVAITANDENEPIRKAIKDIATAIEANIQSEGNIPSIVNLLPEDELEPDGFLYFHHYIWLNSYYYISNDNFLNIDSNSDAILAKYGNNEDRHYLLIVQYPDIESAEKAINSFHEYFPETRALTGQNENKNWLGATYQQNYLIAVFNASQEIAALDLIFKVVNKIQKP